MKKIKLQKISGDGLIPIISTRGNRAEKYVQGYPMPVYPSVPTVGFPFGIYDDDGSSFRTSRITQILSSNTFKTENSTYKWSAQ